MFLFAFPSKSLPWGAIKNYVETHQYILSEAMKLAVSDPAFVQKFPSAEELMNYDYVIVTPLGKSGPGPDVDGASPYSWHYYNPRTGKGLAPKKVADFFSVMMHKRVRGESQAREAAWAAHFLADMFVPYHVAGLTEEEAWTFFMAGAPLGERETGPAALYSRTSPAPPGWGGGGDFSSALELFFNEYPPENDEGVDWFDPWYFNGWGGATAPGIATGSHGFWEYQAWEWFRIRHIVQKSLPPQGYDPLWKNRKSEMGTIFWKAQAAAAAEYTAACAERTRRSIQEILSNPDQGIFSAVRAVYTLYRASMTALLPDWRQEPLGGGGYRVFCAVTNTNSEEAVEDVSLRLLFRKDGKWQEGNTVGLAAPIPPGERREVFWDNRSGDSLQCIVEIAGLYRGTPDLGYVNLGFTTRGMEECSERRFAGRLNFSLVNYPDGKKVNEMVLSVPDSGGAVRGRARLEYAPGGRGGGMKPFGLMVNLKGMLEGNIFRGTLDGTMENFHRTGRDSVSGEWRGTLLEGGQVKGSLFIGKSGGGVSELGFFLTLTKP
jgi:hypothetical protein